MINPKDVMLGLWVLSNRMVPDNSPYDVTDPDELKRLAEDAMCLLEEQGLLIEGMQPVKPFVRGHMTQYYVCGECGGAIDQKDAYCRHCGREVQWDGET